MDLIELLFEFFKFLPEILLSDVVPIHGTYLLFEVRLQPLSDLLDLVSEGVSE